MTNESYISPIKLPGLIIPGNIFLAPIAGYSDASFRSICTDFGAYLCFTEMVSAEALYRGSQKTRLLLQRAENEKILGVQIFASNPVSAAGAVRAIAEFSPDLIDLNCGCSVPKILKSGCGAALLQKPEQIRDIVHAMHQETSVPISVKIRSGWDFQSLNYLKSAEMALEGGAVMIGFHPRTGSQKFTGKANISHIKILKSKIQAPVIGSGDLFSAFDAFNMIKASGCDGIMFARGAVGNPFIFEQARELFIGKTTLKAPSAEKRLAAALKHLMKAVSLKGEHTACIEMRKTFCAYTKGIPGAAQLRKQIVQAVEFKDYERIIDYNKWS